VSHEKSQTVGVHSVKTGKQTRVELLMEIVRCSMKIQDE